MSVKKLDNQLETHNLLQTLGERKRKRGVANSEEEHASEEERVNLGLSRAINAQLNAELLKSERQAKVAHIKELFAAGKYQPDSLKVANAVAEEIVFSILTQGDVAGTELAADKVADDQDPNDKEINDIS